MANIDIDLLTRELISLFENETDKKAVSLLINWFRQMAIHGRMDAHAYQSLERVYVEREEVRSMLAKAIEEEKKNTFQKGKIEDARNMLKEDLSVDLIRRITGLSDDEIVNLTENQ